MSRQVQFYLPPFLPPLFCRLLCAVVTALSTFRRTSVIALVVILGLPTYSSAASRAPLTVEAQQQLYQQTLTAIKKGHKTRTRQGMRALKDYPLYPYLESALLSKQLKSLPVKKVNAFLNKYEGQIVSQQLRRRWLETLASKKQWPRYLQYYRPEVANNERRCWRLQALHAIGSSDLALKQTANIWLSSSSLPDACDPVFKRWQQAGLKTDTLVWQRSQLALAKGNTLLARYLSKHASATLKPYTRRMLSVFRDPSRLRQMSDFSDGTDYSRDIVATGLKRLATKDADLSTQLWVNYRGFIPFTSEQTFAIRDKIARQIIASGSPDALQWLITHDPNAEDSYLLEWRIRLALRNQSWSQVDHWVELLPEKQRNLPRWRYWQARSWQQQQRLPNAAYAVLEKLATERHYYGFMAADQLRQQYGFNHQRLTTADAVRVDSEGAILRAEQFYQMGKLRSARREWRAATRGFDQQQLLAATRLAHDWGWHQQAIHTTIKAGHWNDLSIRFPLAYQQRMLNSAKTNTIDAHWLYAIARQESAFAEDARSHVGARGLMQLMPGTARQVAKALGEPLRQRDLYQPEKNIQLGSHYLRSLLDDFNGNRILATAAYNAGPKRVARWLEKQASELPNDVWIETLPYHETRNYVQNVLAFSVIYSHRLGNQRTLFNTAETVIRPKQSAINQQSALNQPSTSN